MSSAISCIVIKSDRLPKRIPELGEIVRMRGRYGLFTVVSLDQASRVAQLMEKSGQHRIIDVPYADVRTINNTLANTIRRFLDADDSSRRKS